MRERGSTEAQCRFLQRLKNDERMSSGFLPVLSAVTTGKIHSSIWNLDCRGCAGVSSGRQRFSGIRRKIIKFLFCPLSTEKVLKPRQPLMATRVRKHLASPAGSSDHPDWLGLEEQQPLGFNCLSHKAKVSAFTRGGTLCKFTVEACVPAVAVKI